MMCGIDSVDSGQDCTSL